MAPANVMLYQETLLGLIAKFVLTTTFMESLSNLELYPHILDSQYTIKHTSGAKFN